MPFVECFASWSRGMFWWTVPDDMICCYSLYTSSGNDNQLPALMWLDLLMDISLGLPAVTLAKLNPNILDTTYILNLLPLTLRLIIVAERTTISFGGILTLYALCMGYIYQLLRLPTTTSTNCYVYWLLYSSILLSSVMDTLYSSSVLPLRLLESVVRCSLTVLYTLDMISHYFYAGLDHYSQTRHTRRTWLLLSDTSYTPDIAIIHEFILPDVDYISLVEFVERFAVTTPGS